MLKISLGKRCRKTGGAKTLKCDEKLVRLEETYGDWVKQEKENCTAYRNGQVAACH